MGLGLDLATFVGQLVSFVLLLLILARYGYPPIRRAMEERARRVRESVEQAEAARLQYERVQVEAEQELSRARHEAHSIMVQAGAARDRLLQQAKAEAMQEYRLLLDGGRAEIAKERRMMLEQLRREFADAAIETASAIIGETLDADRHRALIVRALDEKLPLSETRSE